MHWKDTDFFTTSNGSPIDNCHLDKEWRKILQKEGLPRIRIHDLRHAILRLLRRCLQRDLRKRLGAISDARLEIEDALADPMALDGPVASFTPTAKWGLRNYIWLAMAVFALAAGLLLGQFFRIPNNTPPMVRRFSISIPPHQALVDTGGTPIQITADGSAIIYSGRGPKGSQLYYRHLDQLEGKPIPETENASGPKISPSGEWIAFVVSDNKTASGLNVMKIALKGGAPILLCNVKSWVGMCWGSENTIYFSGRPGLWKVSAEGGGASTSL